MSQYWPITTHEQTDAMPEGTVLLPKNGLPAVTKADADGDWYVPDDFGSISMLLDDDFPFRVLHIPGNPDPQPAEHEAEAQKVEEAIAELVEDGNLGTECVAWLRGKYGLA